MVDKTQIGITKIEQDDVETAVNKALDLIDAKALMRENMTVLLKPNLLSAKPPERAVTTHPEVLRAVIRWVKQFKPARIIVSDSSSGQTPGRTTEALKTSGLTAICDEEGAEAIAFGKTERVSINVDSPLEVNQVTVSSLLKDVDLVINLPKIKTHGLTILTCCIKNMFGTLILGNKSRIHAQYPTIHQFSGALADIYSARIPDLTIIDGYYCQEGRGPSAGDVVKLDTIIAGYDGVALDAVVCSIIGLNPADVVHVMMAEKKGIGTTDLDKLTIKGASIKDVFRQFKLPPGSKIVGAPIPSFLARPVGRIAFKARVTFNPDRCTRCGTCWTNCPAGAISKPKELVKGNVPVWDASKCITCYCCAEMCPEEAVEFAVHPIRNLIRSWVGVVFFGGLIGFILLLFLLINWLF